MEKVVNKKKKGEEENFVDGQDSDAKK